MAPVSRSNGPSRSDDQKATREAVSYARVSSKEQELGYSIDAQTDLLRAKGAELNFNLHEFFDVETAKTAGRPGFEAMVTYLRKHPNCRTLLVEKTDRLYRNLKDVVTIDELKLDIHLVKENALLTPHSRPSEKFMHGINVLTAKHYIDNLSEEVKKGLRTKAAQKLWPSFAPLGYLNTVRGDGKRVIVPDPDLGPMVTKLFEWFATGVYSVTGLAQKAYREGFRFRKTRAKVAASSVHKILRNRIYTGDFDYAGVSYEGSHEPLVSRQVWERVQEILDGRHKERHTMRQDLAYSGMVRCGHCGCALVGEVKKGQYVYYHCTGYRGKCPERYTREEKIREQFATHIRGVVVPSEVLTWLQSELAESDKTEQAAREQGIRRRRGELERLQARLTVLYDDRLDGRIDGNIYDSKAAAIREQIQQIQGSINSASEGPAMSQAVDLVEVTSKAADLFEAQSGEEQRKLLHLILKEAHWKGGELRLSWREPFDGLQLPSSAMNANQQEEFEALRLTNPGAPGEDPGRVDQEPPAATPMNVEKQPGGPSGEEEAVHLPQSGGTSDGA